MLAFIRNKHNGLKMNIEKIQNYTDNNRDDLRKGVEHTKNKINKAFFKVKAEFKSGYVNLTMEK